MIVTYLCGGLGNQMFQYAMGRALADRHGVPLKLDLSVYASGSDRRPNGLQAFARTVRLFDLRVWADAATPDEIAALKDPFDNTSTRARIVRRVRRIRPRFLWPRTHYRERQYRYHADAMRVAPPAYVEGYWQSEHYFADIKSTIVDEFSPKDASITEYARSYVDALRRTSAPVVALHVRRGDLAHANEVIRDPNLVYGRPVTLDYIAEAMKRFPAGSTFLVFSDTPADIAWCKTNIPGDRLAFSEGHSDIQDMAIMSACDHNITANSTFSWWAAWLNQKRGRRVVTPRQWSPPGHHVFMDTHDLIPADWEMI